MAHAGDVGVAVIERQQIERLRVPETHDDPFTNSAAADSGAPKGGGKFRTAASTLAKRALRAAGVSAAAPHAGRHETQ
jgi:hypothetical protein